MVYKPKTAVGLREPHRRQHPVRLVCRDEMRPNIGHRSHSSLGIDSNNPATRYPRRGDTTADGSKEWWVGSVFFHVARCLAYAYALLGGKGRMVPAAFLLAIPGVRGEVWARALKHKAGRWKGNLVFDRLRRRRTTTNGQPSLSWGRCRRRDKYLASLPVGHPRFPYPPTLFQPASLISTTLATKLLLYLCTPASRCSAYETYYITFLVRHLSHISLSPPEAILLTKGPLKTHRRHRLHATLNL